MFSMKIINFREKVAPFLPDKPGVYIMKNAQSDIIYIGKAKNIKKRVKSYFSGKKDPKTTLLVTHIETIETIITAGESEALLLENNLIKKYKPKYNIDLKDGKTYPVIRVTNEKWPIIYKTRSIINDGSHYFGPFTNVEMLDIYLDLIKKIFPIRRCRGKLRKRETPCLYYHIGECKAPCIGAQSEQEYKKMILDVEALLSGSNEELKSNLQKSMQDSSAELRYEKAAWYRDAIKAIDVITKKQEIVDFDLEVRDYISYAADDGEAIFAVFQMRGGRISGRDIFPISSFIDEKNVLRQFIYQYYEQYHKPASKIYVLQAKGLDGIEEYLSARHNCDSSIVVATEKRDSSILKMVYENCRYELVRAQRKAGNRGAVEELQKVLGLKGKPTLIEGFDIAHLHGQNSVASLITFKRGIPDRSGYRSFNIKSLNGKIDDFEAIREATARRYSRLKNEGKRMPNLILIDGGAGQVSAAKSILNALDLNIPVIGLAKREEEVFLAWQKEPLLLPKGSEALMLLQAVRDETHRFATTKSRKQRALRNL